MSETHDLEAIRAEGFRAGAIYAAYVARRAAEATRYRAAPEGFGDRTRSASARALDSLAASIEEAFAQLAADAVTVSLGPAEKPLSPDGLKAMTALAQAVRARLIEAKAPSGDKRSIAQAKGYTGDECQDCGSFSMVRNGTCLKCENCGSTTGCS